MKPAPIARLVLLACATIVLAAAPRAAAQALAPADSAGVDTTTAPAPVVKPPSRIYYGGGIGLSFSSNVTSVSVQPHVGYKLTKKTSLGASLRYEYFKDSRVVPTAESRSYGGGIFSRHRFHRQVYGAAELAFTHYDWNQGYGSSDVPYFLLGAGYAQPLSTKTWLTVDVMYDLIQDPESPYRDGSPRITTGITANF